MTSSRRAFLGSSAAAAATALMWGCGGGGHARRATGGALARAASAGPIRLDANENPYGPGPAARAALADAADLANRYTDADGALIERIARHHGVTADHVVLYAGSYGLLGVVTIATLHGGGTAVVAMPSFGMVVDELATALGAGVTRVPLTPGAIHDLDALAAAVGTDTRLVYVCNPNNPTGTIVPAADLRAFCTRLAPHATVLVDEAYADYVDDAAFASMDALVADGVPIVVVRTFSKAHGLAGLRVGYALAPPPLAARLRAIRNGPDKAWVPAPSAAAALASLDDAAFVAGTARDTARTRAAFTSELTALGLTVPASHASFVWFAPPVAPSVVIDAMKARGVRIAGRDQLGGCRITIGLPEEMKTAAAALAAVLTTP